MNPTAQGWPRFSSVIVYRNGADHWSDRSHAVLDPEGHPGWILQRLRNPPVV